MYLNENFKEIIEKLKCFFSNQNDICFAYIFGSLARNDVRPLSDVDIAVYFQEKDYKQDLFEKRLELLHRLYQLLGTEKIDLIILNKSPLELNYRILKYGNLISENKTEKRRVFHEKIIHDYLDLHPFLHIRNNTIQKKMYEGSYFD